jgi:DNA-binding response OmpR family regulator
MTAKVVSLGITQTPPKAVDVLIVDDDRLLQAYTHDVLAEAGISTRIASRLDQAREMVAERLPSLIIVDGLLPDGTGVQFLREIRASGITVPVIFLSAFFRDLETFRSLRGPLDVSCILHKPISPANLALRVKLLLDEQSMMEAFEGVTSPPWIPITTR